MVTPMSACLNCGKEHPVLTHVDRVAAALKDALAELRKADVGPGAVSADVLDVLRAARHYQHYVCGKEGDSMQAEFLGFVAGAFYRDRKACP